MSVSQQPAKREVSALELILCHRQPGNLWISRHACTLRYLKALKMGAKENNIFGYGLSVIQRWGFEICKTCPDGRRYTEDILTSPYSKK